ncbi:hypothetical protein [Streptomyces sp. NPDC088915]|uniref:hypothetical protein n=1 Tax=Streptomyces sp. NPDC088915 TaxID=3365912 RepID=UPI00381AD315
MADAKDVAGRHVFGSGRRFRPARATDDLGYSAFLQLNAHHYHRYAYARLETATTAEMAVASAMHAIGAGWPAMLRQRKPAASAWCVLQERIAALRTSPNSLTDRLYEYCPAQAADIAVLRLCLRLPNTAAADLLGVDVPFAEVGLRTAERLLPSWVLEQLKEGIPH